MCVSFLGICFLSAAIAAVTAIIVVIIVANYKVVVINVYLVNADVLVHSDDINVAVIIIIFFAVLPSPVLDGFDQPIKLYCTVLMLSINSATSRRKLEKSSWERRDSNPGQLGYGARTLPLCYAAPKINALSEWGET